MPSQKMKDNTKPWKKLSLMETISRLKEQTRENNMVWSEELSVDFSNEVEFLLSYKGRWLLCHMGKDYPFYIRYRIIGDRIYSRVKPEKFISIAKEILYH